ncbi:MAG: ATP-dependent DNA helicase DinG [Gammaproteobacteria bacterium]|nr:ATP-dependent DNA helicase DinG [Gammaproteobacteria bacterium]MBQ0840818.1 ATP-dependent DNA helicase DinG [Gammaproteobacteria bacterium]
MSLSDQDKATIQSAYRDFLAARSLRPRLGQRQMIGHIASFLGAIERDDEGQRVSDNNVIAIEAGTGTGKTVAYLLSVLSLAKAAGKKVVVATGTVALQGQLLDRDIPDVMAATGWDYKLALAKGRGRYLCPLRLQQCSETAKAQDAGLFLFEDELAFEPDRQSAATLQAMGEALQSGSWDGDRDAWPEAVPTQTWQALTVDRNQCAGRRCRLIGECCFFQAREALEGADCIVANHDLVMADLALGGGAILSAPEDTIYVFDEAHRLGNTALNHFASQCRLKATAQWLEQMQKTLKAMATPFAEMPDIIHRGNELGDIVLLARQLLQQATPLFESTLENSANTESKQNFGNGQLRHRYPGGRIDEACRALSEDLTAVFVRLSSRLENLHGVLEEALENAHQPVPRVDIEQYFQVAGQWLGRASGATELWTAMAHPDPAGQPPMARWLSYEDSGDIRLSVSPISAGLRLNDLLWQRCYAAVTTSATLRVLGDFERFKNDSGMAAMTQCEAVAGAFDYANAGLLVVPDIGAEAGDARAHTQALIEHLPALLYPEDADEDEPLCGGVLVLFASRRQMEELVDALADDLPWQLLVQGELSTAEIVSRHRARIDQGERSVIFGLASFAEGMDLPGAYCQHVIIAKLPFAVPDDPLQAALAEWVESKGGNAFREITLPDAALRLIQACGRLLRHEDDRGRVTILDRRLVSKSYGRQLLASLPPFKQVIEHA